MYKRLAAFDAVPSSVPTVRTRMDYPSVHYSSALRKKKTKNYGICEFCAKVVCMKTSGFLYLHNNPSTNLRCTGANKRPICVNMVCPEGHETTYSNIDKTIQAHIVPGTMLPCNHGGRRAEVNYSGTVVGLVDAE